MFLFLFYIFSRCVPDNQRSFAVGVQFLVMRLLSFLPGPIIIGAIFDSQCITWGYDGCGRKKNCLDYDMKKLSTNLSIFGLATLGKYLSKPLAYICIFLKKLVIFYRIKLRLDYYI